MTDDVRRGPNTPDPISGGAQAFEVRARRELAQPAKAVYRAWTEPDLVRGWWGPIGFTCPVARMDVRVGGTSLVAMRAPAEYGGGDIFNTWTYSRVESGSRLEYASRFATPEGEPITPVQAGIPGDVPPVVPHVVVFEPVDEGRSTVTITESGYSDQATRDMSAAGLEQCLDKLEKLLSSG
jgi:uncharacterized protein YndB with AHSA1/START domain